MRPCLFVSPHFLSLILNIEALPSRASDCFDGYSCYRHLAPGCFFVDFNLTRESDFLPFRKLFFLCSFLLFGIAASPARAEQSYWAIGSGSGSIGFPVMSVDPVSGSSITHGYIKKLDPNTYLDESDYYEDVRSMFVDKSNGDLYMTFDNFGRVETYKYNKDDNTLTEATWWADSYQRTVEKSSLVKDSSGNILFKYGDQKLFERKDNGEIHIGENSLVTKEEGGRQRMWATDANGDSIDIDITNGSRLLINGRDVEKSIDNVGALSAALGSVPAISADSQFTCGFGAGTYSSAYALSTGCASRVSDRVSVNAALATVINNHTGDSDDNLSARAGFTFKLGKIDDSPKVASRKAAVLHDKVAKLEENNQALAATNKSLMKLLQAQSARLDNLEKIASGQLSLLGNRASSD